MKPPRIVGLWRACVWLQTGVAVAIVSFSLLPDWTAYAFVGIASIMMVIGIRCTVIAAARLTMTTLKQAALVKLAEQHEREREG